MKTKYPRTAGGKRGQVDEVGDLKSLKAALNGSLKRHGKRTTMREAIGHHFKQLEFAGKKKEAKP